MDSQSYLCLFAVTIICMIGQIECGECCKIYSLLNSNTKETWCSDYCCKTLGSTYCCSESYLHAPEEDRLPFCAAWFSDFVWVPILVVIGVVVLCVGCCICCCRGRGRGTVIIHGPQTGGTTVVASQQTMMNSMPAPSSYNAGYNPEVAPSPYSAGYDQP
ncbi:uncharacterized protein LOC133199969 [Saccostrea echinata]|uniref:uncharacterized protein LOC133199969 n=1 Tax=Saccostrea echinata TaxID=191078 RepID=UPI002A84007D|nr:uncharacterized protein LOC133199969 [Saccostrea echinata]